MPVSDLQAVTRTDAFEARLKKRRRAEMRFKAYGLTAIGFAGLLLIVLLTSVVLEAKSAFTRYNLRLEIKPERADTRVIYDQIRGQIFDIFPEVENDRNERIEVGGLVTILAAQPVAEKLKTAEIGRAGRLKKILVPISDQADMYLKGEITGQVTGRVEVVQREEQRLQADFSRVYASFRTKLSAEISRFRSSMLAPAEQEYKRLLARSERAPDDVSLRERMAGAKDRFDAARAQMADMQARLAADAYEFRFTDPSLLIELDDGTWRATAIAGDHLDIEPLLTWAVPQERQGQYLLVSSPRIERPITDRQIAATQALKQLGYLSRDFNVPFLFRADSSEAEMAGVLGALIGSILIMVVTMCLAVPVGIAAAIYLEEFAPRTWLTRLIQININNLAAVPSIVFGLLGAAIFINGVAIDIPFTDWNFTLGGGLGRGWPVVGGLVLALMTLPTIIISSRAALAAVPDSIRQAALGVGASRLQMVGHHVLPQAGPGILTGSIIGLAQALGETAPLLLIGMVAFIGDLPNGLNERSTALPVLIYQWSTRAERAWEPMTSAAIIVLLLVMLAMNAVAIWLRLKYERK